MISRIISEIIVTLGLFACIATGTRLIFLPSRAGFLMRYTVTTSAVGVGRSTLSFHTSLRCQREARMTNWAQSWRQGLKGLKGRRAERRSPAFERLEDRC